LAPVPHEAAGGQCQKVTERNPANLETLAERLKIGINRVYIVAFWIIIQFTMY